MVVNEILFYFLTLFFHITMCNINGYGKNVFVKVNYMNVCYRQKIDKINKKNWNMWCSYRLLFKKYILLMVVINER